MKLNNNSREKKKSNTRELYIERIKYLLGTSFKDLNLEDRMNLIAMKLVLDPMEYYLLKRLSMNNWIIEELSKEFVQTNTQMKAEISKIITKVKPVAWNYNNSPFKKDDDKKITEKYINLSDMVIESFLNSDSVTMSVKEFIALTNETLVR